jgi:aminoglycoside N3'-acetyltransferase
MITPRAAATTWEPTVVALAGATTKTVLQLGIPTTTDVLLLGWGVSFDGTASSNVPVICQLIEGVVASTGTLLTPELWGGIQQPTSLCVSGTALTSYAATAEGTITGTPRVFDQQHVHPQSGYGVWWDPPAAPACGSTGAAFVRVRCKAPVAVNVIPWLVWREPSI